MALPAALATKIPVGPIVAPKIGVVAPYDMALDHEMARWAAGKADLYFARSQFEALDVSVEMAHRIGQAAVVTETATRLSAISPDCYLYACTSGSFINGITGERELVSAIQHGGIPNVITTSGAILSALKALNLTKIAIATPYDELITENFIDFLNQGGRTVCSTAQMGLSGEIWKVPYSHTADLILGADHHDAEAIVVSCTNLPTYDIIAPLERYLRKPVITANQATMWAGLTRLSLPASGPGQLLLDATRDMTCW